MSSDIIPANLLGKMDLIEKIHTKKNMLKLTEELTKQHGVCNKNDFNKKIESNNNDEMKTQSNLNNTKSNKFAINEEGNLDKKSQISQAFKKTKRLENSKTKKIKKKIILYIIILI
jgi:hypothetical protein